MSITNVQNAFAEVAERSVSCNRVTMDYVEGGSVFRFETNKGNVDVFWNKPQDDKAIAYLAVEKALALSHG